MNAALIHAAVSLLQDTPNPEEQYSTGCNTGHTPVVAEICPPVTDGTPTAANNAEDAPAIAARTWHYTAMSAATFTLSAFLAHIATKAICKRIRSRN